MNPETLLDFQLGQLDEAQSAACEAEFAADPALAARAARLAARLRLLLDDGEDPTPPSDLAERTIRFVAESRSTILMRPEWTPQRARFRPADLAVAASILLAAAATLVPAVARIREQMNITHCANNLRELGTLLGGYASTHGHFPFARDDKPLGVHLAEIVTNARRDPEILSCPSNRGGYQLASVQPESPIDKLLKQIPPEAHPGLNHGYAFQVGYRNAMGRPVGFAPAGELNPIVADPPQLLDPCGVADGNSPSHNRIGQNALFSDLHVRWLPDRRWRLDNDIYRNRAGRCSYGFDERDVSLMPLLMPMQD